MCACWPSSRCVPPPEQVLLRGVSRFMLRFFFFLLVWGEAVSAEMIGGTGLRLLLLLLLLILLGRPLVAMTIRQAHAIARTTTKKSVALVVGYVGTGYYGLQMTPMTSADEVALPTIENELRKALVSSAFISQDNSLDLSKIGWCRSSRTDKGVHAARLVLSARLSFPRQEEGSSKDQHVADTLSAEEAWYDTHFRDVARKCNEHLPPQIRIFSAAKVNRSFRARTACNWRAYEYILPIELLLTESECNLPISESMALSKLQLFNTFLQQLEGSQSFHNFHRLSAKTVLKYGNKSKKSSPASAPPLSPSQSTLSSEQQQLQDEEEEEEEEAEEVGEELNASEEGKEEEGVRDGVVRGRSFINPYANWQPVHRPISAKCEGNVYRCRAEFLPLDTERRMLRVRIVGQSFLLHQIRLMVSSAILCTRCQLPENFIEAALLLPFHLQMPMAPAEGLVLDSSGFSFNKNGEDWVLSAAQAASPRDMALMSDSEWLQSEDFKHQVIYPRMVESWTAPLMNSYLDFASRFTAPASLTSRWADMLANERLSRQTEEDAGRERQAQRVAKLAKEFAIALEQQQTAASPTPTTEGPMPVPRASKTRQKTFTHRSFLPNGVATQAAVMFQVIPGPLVTDVLRSLATQIAQGTLAPNLSPNQLLQEIRHAQPDPQRAGDREALERYVLEHPPHELIL